MFDEFYMKIFSKLKEILEKLNLYDGKFSEISTKVDNTNTAVESVSTDIATVQIASNEIKSLIGTAISTQLSTLQKNIIAAMPSGSNACIRHIQRGTESMSSRESYVTITLSGFTNLSKMFVIINGFRAPAKDCADYVGAPYMNSLSLSQLEVICHGSDNLIGGTAYFSYQVIEFY